EKVEKAAIERAKLFLMPAALNAEEEKKIQDWNETLWKSLDGWAMTDPMHKDLVTTLKAAYYQSQVRIEEYFIDKNIRPENAKFLALATLKNIVAPYLERFIYCKKRRCCNTGVFYISFSAFQSKSFSSIKPLFVLADIKTKGTSFGIVGSSRDFNSSSIKSALVIASTRGLSSNSSLYIFNSLTKMSYCFSM